MWYGHVSFKQSAAFRSFRKIAKATVGFVMSLSSFNRMEQLIFPGGTFINFYNLCIFRKYVKNSSFIKI